MSSFQIVKSKTNQSIPIIDGIHLHSVYDPQKEAQDLIDDYHSQLKENNRVLVLGLGFGYHLEEIVKILNIYHSEYIIYVIEPNQDLFKAFKSEKEKTNQNLEIISSSNVNEIYTNKELLYFLSSGPTVIAHPTSLNINSNFFHNFMDFSQKEDIKSLSEQIDDEKIKNYLQNFVDQNINFEEMIEQIKNKQHKTKDDLLFLILDHIN